MPAVDPKLLCAPERKAQIEAANGVEQLDYIAHLVNDLKITKIRESHVQELKAIAIRGIYPCGINYRNANMHVRIAGSKHNVGVPTMPVLIARRRDEYIACLKAADEAEEAGRLDISKMTAFLTEVLTQQLESALSKFGLKIART